MAKRRTGTIDKTLGWLPVEVRGEFLDWCSTNPTGTAICREINRLIIQYKDHKPKDAPVKITQSHVYKWYKKAFPPTSEIVAITEVARKYQGADASILTSSTMGALYKVLSSSMERIIDEEAVNCISLDSLFEALPGYFRELRSLAALTQKFKAQQNVEDIFMDGAQRMADILLITLKDTTHEKALHQAIIGAFKQLEDEISPE
ncbi:MAG: hypothetical protein AAGA83_00375 [Cyanobacteria bacterium P01_F01_bin.116]